MTPHIPATSFHPHLCSLHQNAAVVCPRTNAVLFLYASHVAARHCFVTCYVYDYKAWSELFSKVRIAEAVHKTRLAFVTREHAERGWV